MALCNKFATYVYLFSRTLMKSEVSMADPVTIDEARSTQKSNYLVLSLRAEFALGESIALLDTRRTLTGDGDETRDITFRIALFEAERAKIKAERIAFLQEGSTIKPPKKTLVDKVRNLAAELDEMIAANVTTKAILSVTSSVMALFNSTMTG